MLAERSTRADALITVFRREGLWPPLVPSVVLVECLSGRPDKDARTNQFLKTCEVQTVLGEKLARRAAHLRGLARKGSVVDAVVGSRTGRRGLWRRPRRSAITGSARRRCSHRTLLHWSRAGA